MDRWIPPCTSKSPHQFNNQIETRAINQGSYYVGPGRSGPAVDSQHELNQYYPTGPSPPPPPTAHLPLLEVAVR